MFAIMKLDERENGKHDQIKINQDTGENEAEVNTKDDVLIMCYALDFCKLITALHEKSKKSGKENYEIISKIKEIEEKIRNINQNYKYSSFTFSND